MSRYKFDYKSYSPTDLVYGLMLIWKQRVDGGLDEEDIVDDCCDESYIGDLLFCLSLLCDEYGVDFNKLAREACDD